MKKNLTICFLRIVCIQVLFFITVLGQQLYAQTNNAALNFDGNDDQVNMGNVLNMGTNDFTVEAWFNAKSFQVGAGDNLRILLIKGGSLCSTPQHAGYGLFLHNRNATNTLGFYVNNVTVTKTGLSTDKWYHVVGVRQGNQMSLYIDGQFIGSESTGTVVNTNNTDNFCLGTLVRPVGTSCGANPPSFDGSLDEVRIWNRAVSASEITANAFKIKTGTEGGLLAYYDFEEGTPNGNNVGKTTLKDLAGGDQNGTLSSFALTGSTSNFVAISTNSSLDQGLVAHYPFDGNAKDIGPNGLHSPVEPKFADFGNGKLGAKFLGNGVPGGISVTDRRFATRAFTVSAYVKNLATRPSTNGFGEFIITKGGYNLGGKIVSIYRGAQYSYTIEALIKSKIDANKGYLLPNPIGPLANVSDVHVVFACDGTTMKLYCNGKLVKRDINPNEVFDYENANNSSSWMVSMGGFVGMMQNVRFYDRMINDNEVNILFQKDSEKKTIDKIDIIPNSSGRAGRLIAYVRGKGFTDRSEVRLRMTGEEPIPGKVLRKLTDNLLEVEFNFTESEKTGKYDIEVRNFVNATVYTQPKAFDLKRAKKSRIGVNIGGYSYIGFGLQVKEIESPPKVIDKGKNNPGHFNIKILSDGNTPIEDVEITVVIQQLERNVPLQIQNIKFDHSLNSVEKIIFKQPTLNFSEPIEGIDDNGLSNYTMTFTQKVMYPGFDANLKFEVLNKIQDNSVGKFVIAVQKAAKFNNPTMPEFACSDCVKCGFDLAGLVPLVGCFAGFASASCTFLEDNSRVLEKTKAAIGVPIGCVGIIGKIFGGLARKIADNVLFKIADRALDIDGVNSAKNNCEACGIFTHAEPHEVLVTSFRGLKNNEEGQLSIRNSNEGAKINGPTGFTNDRFIGNGTKLKYGIEYENLLRDTVGSMVFTQQLDTSVFDLSTFGFSNYGMGDTIFQHFNGDDDFIAFDHDLRPRKNTILRHIAVIDRVKGNVEWYFNSLDPNTYEPIAHKKQGFLPPNDSTGKGLGFVEYYIEAKSDLSHNTKIKSTADINLDSSATIKTPSWINTIDDKKPTSTLKGRHLNDTTFQVIFSGSDLGSGVRFYDLYISENKTKYRLLASNLRRDTINVILKKGVKYNFFSQARDNVGNWEDTTHTAKVSPIKENIKEQDNFKIYPNPTTGIVNIESPWESDPAQIIVTDVIGRIIYQQKTGQTKITEVDLSAFSSGIYFISLKNERTGEIRTAKLIHN